MSEMVKALGMALGSNHKDKWGGKAPLATCSKSSCGEPLIATMRFSFKEFVCICCGATYGYVEPTPQEATKERQARHDALRKDWDAAGPFEDEAAAQAWLDARVESG